MQLENGDVVLVEGDDAPQELSSQEPIVSIRFASEVQDMLGEDVLAVAEAMLDAATELIYAPAEEGAGAIDFTDVAYESPGENTAGENEHSSGTGSDAGSDTDAQDGQQPIIVH